MQILTNPDNIAHIFPNGCVATIGNFDGVHLGHQKLVGQVVQAAKAKQIPSVVISFDPHPLKIMRGKNAPASLVTNNYKLECLEQLGVDFVLLLTFNKELADQTPEEFVEKILVKALHITHLFVGYDYAFGKERKGNAELLASLGQIHGFLVTQLEPVQEAGNIVSSTHIRELLRKGKLSTANALLHRPHTVEGVVVHGQGRGSKMLGFATANIEQSTDILLPPSGVYAVKILFLDNHGKTNLAQEFLGVASVGTNPTFGDEGLHLEVHILDFDQDVYGQKLRVQFFTHLRSEKTFNSVQDLIAQIKSDIAQAKNFFANLEKPSL